MAFKAHGKLKYIGCGCLTVIGLVVLLFGLAIIGFFGENKSPSACSAVSDPGTQAVVTPYPGATWVDGHICGAFFSSTTSHLYVSTEDIAVLTPYYQAQMTALAETKGEGVHQPGPNSFTVSVVDDGSYWGAGVSISTTVPEGWKLDKKTQTTAKSYILVTTGGGFS